MKRSTTTLLLVLTALFVANGQSLKDDSPDGISWIGFDWGTQHIDDKIYKYSYINIPIKIGEIEDKFTMQFDLGANLTGLYGRTFTPYWDVYASLKDHIDMINGYPYLAKIPIILNQTHEIEEFSFFYKTEFGEGLDKNKVGDGSVKHIGTIGADLFKDKILIIDYPNSQLAILNEMPIDYKDLDTYVNIELDRWGRVHVPVKVNEQEKKVLFDTGSSIFPLMTSTDNWNAATNGTKQDSILTTTWGEKYYTYAANVETVAIGDRQLTDLRIFDAQNQSNFIKNENIWGIMGNAHFLNDVIIIDFKNLTFGWMEGSD